MAQFEIKIIGIGGNGCDGRAVPGDKLHGRCGKFTCPDCLAFDFTQRLRQGGFTLAVGEFTRNPNTAVAVVDDLLTNTRKSGQF